LFGIHTVTDPNGCFDLGGIDRSSEQLVVEAPGFAPLSAPAKSGIYRASVVVVTPNSTDSGNVRWSESDAQSLKSVPGCP
jgi:hypothetical protein